MDTSQRVEVTTERLSLRFRTPIRTSYGTLEERELIHLKIVDQDGITAYGEAAPLEPYDGVSIEETQAALDSYRPLLEADLDSGSISELLARCEQLAPIPPALAAVDLAVRDLFCKRTGISVSESLSTDPAGHVEINATPIGADANELADDAKRLQRSGFQTLKVKVGVEDDIERVAAVREAVDSSTKLRIDANGAWSTEQVLAQLEQFAKHEIELCEEPVSGAKQLRLVAERSPIPIAIDESGTDTETIATSGCQIACLKISRLGGIGPALEAAREARAAGMTVYLASTYDGTLGIAAALQAAAIIKPDHASGLDTIGLLNVRDPFQVDQGQMMVPTGPGLGVEPSTVG